MTLERTIRRQLRQRVENGEPTIEGQLVAKEYVGGTDFFVALSVYMYPQKLDAPDEALVDVLAADGLRERWTLYANDFLELLAGTGCSAAILKVVHPDFLKVKKLRRRDEQQMRLVEDP